MTQSVCSHKPFSLGMCHCHPWLMYFPYFMSVKCESYAIIIFYLSSVLLDSVLCINLKPNSRSVFFFLFKKKQIRKKKYIIALPWALPHFYIYIYIIIIIFSIQQGTSLRGKCLEYILFDRDSRHMPQC